MSGRGYNLNRGKKEKGEKLSGRWTLFIFSHRAPARKEKKEKGEKEWTEKKKEKGRDPARDRFVIARDDRVLVRGQREKEKARRRKKKGGKKSDVLDVFLKEKKKKRIEEKGQGAKGGEGKERVRSALLCSCGKS